jgi:hypothetical protein
MWIQLAVRVALFLDRGLRLLSWELGRVWSEAGSGAGSFEEV